MSNKSFVYTFFLLVCLFSLSCEQRKTPLFRYQPPEYNNLQILPTKDTIRFALDENTYNNIRAFNCFVDKGKEYVSFYDKVSLSVNIYEVSSKRFIKRVSLKQSLPGRPLEKRTSVYCKNLDSLFVINNIFLYLLDNKGILRDSVVFDAGPILAFPGFDKKKPPVFRGTALYLGAVPYLSTSKKRELRKWENLYTVDLTTKKTKLTYPLPDVYMDSIYSSYFIENSYCVNDKGRFVFSFAADTNIYETDLNDYNMAYYGKSHLQNSAITGIRPGEIKEPDDLLKSYLIRYSYDAIYYDLFNKRYLRIAEQKISDEDYRSNNRDKNKSVIIFNDAFKIVGETNIDSTLSWNTVFFTKNGDCYVRTNANDEQAINFVRMEYIEGTRKLSRK